MKRLVFYLALAILCVFSAQVIAGPTYSFDRITNNANADIAGQFTVELTDTALGVSFTFRNAGPYGVVHEVYFDDGTLLGEPTITSSSGVLFVPYSVDPVSPPVLPGGDVLTPPFVVTALLSVDVDQNGDDGIGSGEWLTLDFTLQGSAGLAEVIAALDLERDIQGSLSIGIHVHSIETSILDDDESDSFVNNGVIPAPGAILLGGIGVGLVGWLRRRRTL